MEKLKRVAPPDIVLRELIAFPRGEALQRRLERETRRAPDAVRHEVTLR
jgi:hypothetical protein